MFQRKKIDGEFQLYELESVGKWYPKKRQYLNEIKWLKKGSFSFEPITKKPDSLKTNENPQNNFHGGWIEILLTQIMH